jgi:hypothetical protein
MIPLITLLKMFNYRLRWCLTKYTATAMIMEDAITPKAMSRPREYSSIRFSLIRFFTMSYRRRMVFPYDSTEMQDKDLERRIEEPVSAFQKAILKLYEQQLKHIDDGDALGTSRYHHRRFSADNTNAHKNPDTIDIKTNNNPIL